MMQRIFSFTWILLAGFSTTQAQSPRSLIEDAENPSLKILTLDRALAIAARTHPALAAHRHRIGMAEGDATQAGLWPNPEFSIAFESVTPDANNQPLSGRPDQRQSVVGISQPIPISGTMAKARKAAKIDIERWRAEYDAQSLDLLASVKGAFLAVVYHQESLNVMQELQDTFVQILNVSKARFESGDTAEAEVMKAEANHERFIMDAELIGHNLNLAMGRLAELLGDPSLAIERCVGNLDGAVPDISRENVSMNSQQHPRARVWELAQDKAEADVVVTQSEKWPVPNLGVGYRHYESTGQDTWDFSLGFKIPIFNRNQGEIRKARESVKREEAIAATQSNAMQSQLDASMMSYETHKHRASVFQQRILPKMEQSFEITQTSFSIGDVTILEVLDAYRSLSEARLTYLEELFQLRSTVVELERLTGHTFQ